MGGMNLAAFTAPFQYARPVQQETPWDAAAKFGQLRALAQMAQLRQAEVQNQQLQAQRMQQDLQNEAAVRQLFQGPTEPTSQQIFAAGGPKYGAEVNKGILDMHKSRADMQKAQLDHAQKEAEFIGQTLGDAKDDATYQPALAQLRAAGVDTSRMPANYDKPTVDGYIQKGQTIIQQIEQKRAAALAAPQLAEAQTKAAGAELDLASRTVPSDPNQWGAWRSKFSKDTQDRIPEQYSPEAAQQVRTMGVPITQQPKWTLETIEANAARNMDAAGIEKQVAGSIDPTKYPDEYKRTVNNAKNALLWGLGGKGVDAAINSGSNRISQRENAIAQAAVTTIPFKEEAQARALREEGEKSYQASSKELDKFGTPVSKSIQDYNTLKTMLANPNNVQDSVLVPEFLKFAAGGSGSGLRMTAAEMNRIYGSRSLWDNLKAGWLKLTTGQTLLPDQRQKMAQAVDSMGQRLLLKDRIINQAHDDLIRVNDPAGHKAILESARRALAIIDQETPGQNAAGGGAGPTATGGGGGGGPVVQWTRDAQGNPVPVR